MSSIYIWLLLYPVVHMYVDEWKNFQQRVEWDEELKENEDKNEELRLWASYRGQTLARTGIAD
jgi:callose synthase